MKYAAVIAVMLVMGDGVGYCSIKTETINK